jgi:hypothetical protein
MIEHPEQQIQAPKTLQAARLRVVDLRTTETFVLLQFREMLRQ